MGSAHPFIRFNDFGLRSFAVTGNVGTLLPKTQRIIDFEKQDGNGYYQYPFGTSGSNGSFSSVFANDDDYGQPGINRLGPNVDGVALNPTERKVIAFFQSIINFLTPTETTTTIGAFAVANEPDIAYTFTNTAFGGTAIEVYALPNSPTKNRTFSLCISAQSSTWLVQWFISERVDTGMTGLYTEYVTKTLPLTADANGFSFETYFYDLDFVNFPTDEMVSPMPIKSFDVLRFNLLPDDFNLYGLTDVVIGLMDSDGNIVDSDIGSATLPICANPRTYKIYISNAALAGMAAEYGTGYLTLNILSDIPELVGEIPIDDVDFSTLTTLGDSFVNSFAPTFDNDFDVSYEILGGTILVVTFVLTTCVTFYQTIEDQAGFMPMVPDGDLGYTWPTQEEGMCLGATQLQATATIPGNLDQSCFRLYLWDGYVGQVYGFSNLFELNDYDDFPQMVLFANNGIFQGFEYFDDWSQQMRLPLSIPGAPQPNITDSQYRDGSGNFRSPSRKSDLLLDLHSGWIDNPTLEALFAATQHSSFIVSGQSLFVQGDIEVSHPQDFTTESSYFGLAQAKFSAKKQNYQPLDNGCINC